MRQITSCSPQEQEVLRGRVLTIDPEGDTDVQLSRETILEYCKEFCIRVGEMAQQVTVIEEEEGEWTPR